MCLSEACLEASDVGALARGVHPRGSGFVEGAQPSGGPSCAGWGGCAG